MKTGHRPTGPIHNLFDTDGAFVGVVVHSQRPLFAPGAPTLLLRRSGLSRQQTAERVPPDPRGLLARQLRRVASGLAMRRRRATRAHGAESWATARGRLAERGLAPRGYCALPAKQALSRFALGVAVLVASACSSLPQELEPFDGTFDYVAFDEAGTRVLAGRLVLDVDDGGGVTGSWDIDWVAGADRDTPVGPQVGNGGLVGAILDGDLTLDLTPMIADNDVVLVGALDGSRITGSWQYVTLAGPAGSGTFWATRR